MFFWIEEESNGPTEGYGLFAFESTSRFWTLHQPSDPGRPGPDVATLHWKLCRAHGQGLIEKISVSEHLQRQGLATDLMDYAVNQGGDGPRWATTPQSPDGQPCFISMAERIHQPFPADGSHCSCIDPSRAVRPGRSQPVELASPPTLE